MGDRIAYYVLGPEPMLLVGSSLHKVQLDFKILLLLWDYYVYYVLVFYTYK